MIITYHGLSFCKVQLGDTVIAVNPISKGSKRASTKFGADIVLVSLQHPDFNGIEQVSYGDRVPFTINGPGEYEVKGVSIKGVGVSTVYEKENRIVTAYSISLEGMNLCFLGPIKSKDSLAEAVREFDDIDLLFVPIGGGEVLSPVDAHKLSVSLEPKIIIPVFFDGSGAKSPLGVFLKEGGNESVKSVDRLTIRKKDLEGKEEDVVILELL
jgi:L-ascorbate metabolism protein UlaG (beta-lactamase superfamily)